MPRLLLATKNAHKTSEIRAMLGAQFLITDLNEHPELPPVEETGSTFAENATLKALAGSKLFPGWVLADDSGLEVDALGGAPGVFSARYAGHNASDADNRSKLLVELSSVRGKARSARFRCVLALAHEGQLLGTFDGVIEGTLGNQEHGDGGFGYDPLFIPENHCQTFAQLPPETKNQLSHRARALAALREFLKSQGRALGL